MWIQFSAFWRINTSVVSLCIFLFWIVFTVESAPFPLWITLTSKFSCCWILTSRYDYLISNSYTSIAFGFLQGVLFCLSKTLAFEKKYFEYGYCKNIEKIRSEYSFKVGSSQLYDNAILSALTKWHTTPNESHCHIMLVKITQQEFVERDIT